ncbi:G-protein alpha subunit-domain-containing protein [Mycena rebaudengoi]|nr:G-protein alpha subunit-domain-containing protein [Mycena rebaudengoi]
MYLRTTYIPQGLYYYITVLVAGAKREARDLESFTNEWSNNDKDHLGDIAAEGNLGKVKIVANGNFSEVKINITATSDSIERSNVWMEGVQSLLGTVIVAHRAHGVGSGERAGRAGEPTSPPSRTLSARARTIGVTETTFVLREHEMLMFDVGGQKSERRKWIHCFQDVTSILFLVSLNGYDQCLVEDRDARWGAGQGTRCHGEHPASEISSREGIDMSWHVADTESKVRPRWVCALQEMEIAHRGGVGLPGRNQMQDAMSIWDSICHSGWFRLTSIILFLNKDDLFQEKIKTSDIKNFFPSEAGYIGSHWVTLVYPWPTLVDEGIDFDGEAGSAHAGRDYFKKRFKQLAQKAGRTKERESCGATAASFLFIFVHLKTTANASHSITTATDTELLRMTMAAVEATRSTLDQRIPPASFGGQTSLVYSHQSAHRIEPKINRPTMKMRPMGCWESAYSADHVEKLDVDSARADPWDRWRVPPLRLIAEA